MLSVLNTEICMRNLETCKILENNALFSANIIESSNCQYIIDLVLNIAVTIDARMS